MASRRALQRAVRDGKIISGDCYYRCDTCQGVVGAHHYLGYEKEHMYDVIWVCMHHHYSLEFRLQKLIYYLFFNPYLTFE